MTTDETVVVRGIDREDDATRLVDALNRAGIRAYAVGPYPVSRWDVAPDGVEWTVTIHVPVREVVRSWFPDVEPDEHDMGRSTLWDEAVEDRLTRGD